MLSWFKKKQKQNTPELEITTDEAKIVVDSSVSTIEEDKEEDYTKYTKNETRLQCFTELKSFGEHPEIGIRKEYKYYLLQTEFDDMRLYIKRKSAGVHPIPFGKIYLDNLFTNCVWIPNISNYGTERPYHESLAYILGTVSNVNISELYKYMTAFHVIHSTVYDMMSYKIDFKIDNVSDSPDGTLEGFILLPKTTVTRQYRKFLDLQIQLYLFNKDNV